MEPRPYTPMLPNSRENSPVSSQCCKRFMSFMWVCFFAVISRHTISQSSWVLPSCSLDSSPADHCVCVYIIIFTDWLTYLLTYLLTIPSLSRIQSFIVLSVDVYSCTVQSCNFIALLPDEYWTYRLLISNDCLITFVIIVSSAWSHQHMLCDLYQLASLFNIRNCMFRIT